MGKMCQSCGMPLNKDEQGGGSEADGAKSETYCSFCYADGAFLQQEITALQMQDFCVTALQDKGMPKIMAWLFTRGIPKLGRWKQQP